MKHLYILLFILPLIGFGQGWEQMFGGSQIDFGSSVQQTTDGGYIITGYTESFGNGEEDIYLIKTNENGEEEWSQNFGGIGRDISSDVQQTTDSGYIIVGSSQGVMSIGWEEHIYLLKTNESGEEEWSQIFEGDRSKGYSIQQTINGGYIICGTIFFSETGEQDVYVIKTNEIGEEEWSQNYGGNGDDVGYSIQQTIDGGYIVCSVTNSFETEFSDVWLIKIDGDGEEEWSQTFGGEFSDRGFSIQQTTDSGYVFSGWTKNEDGDEDIMIIKTDNNGIGEWSQTFGGDEDDVGFSISQTLDGGYIIGGFTEYKGDEDVLILKTDNNGVEQWSQTFGGDGDDKIESIQQTSDGGYIMSGGVMTSSEFSSYDVYLIKTDSEGNVETTSTIELPTPTSKRELIKTTNILGQENTTIKNQPLIEIYDDGSTEKKIVIE